MSDSLARIKRYAKKILKRDQVQNQEPPIQILLLTNRDSDNIGDQVIEASDIGLISAVMKNLDITNYKIESRAAAIVTQKYLSTKDENLLKLPRKVIKEADLVVFGGAPMFNFQYQNFYERTAVTLEIAQEFQKPVIFSAIGVEGYSDTNKKCQRLKKTLHNGCVKQITTRDDFEALSKYTDQGDIPIDKVSDPAVFCADVFKYPRTNDGEKKKVGVFVLRSNGFVDNKFNFTREDVANLWKELSKELEQRGYAYEFITSGHFGDEAFLEHLIDNYNIDASKCVFNMNTPEQLLKKISSYDAVVSCRLHPSIIAFSANVPSVGLVWNYKVKTFYESIGYADRVLEVEQISARNVADKVDAAIAQGIEKDKDYLISVYQTMFSAMKDVFAPDSEKEAYSYDELVANIPQFKGTSKNERDEKLKRKFRRTYKKYNEMFEKNLAFKEEIRELKRQLEEQKQ